MKKERGGARLRLGWAVLPVWLSLAWAGAAPASASVTAASSPSSAACATVAGGSGGATGSVGSGGSVVSGGSVGSGSASPASSQESSARTGSGGGLAFTGADVLPWLAAGGLLVGAGCVLLLAARRRRRPRADSLGCALAGLLVVHQLAPAASSGSSCSPPAVLPETPVALLLPLVAGGIFVGAWLYARRRAATRGAGS